MEQSLEGGEQRHENGRPLALAQLPQPARHLPVNAEALPPAPLARHGPAPAVCRQFKLNRRTAQLLTPVRELLFEHFAL